MLAASTSPQSHFVAVATAADQALFEASHLGAGRLVVVVVESLDELERPATLEHITADDAPPQRRRLVGMAGSG